MEIERNALGGFLEDFPFPFCFCMERASLEYEVRLWSHLNSDVASSCLYDRTDVRNLGTMSLTREATEDNALSDYVQIN